jgi:hypothetical protein
VIDLDALKMPDWSQVRYGLAAGYPDGHKNNTTQQDVGVVATQLIVVVAEFASKPRSEQKTITLNSVLNDPHTWYFSGLSGGPLYVVEGMEKRHADYEEFFPVGIVFEGYPSSGCEEALANPDRAASFLSETDIFIRAHALMPDIFDEWVRDCGY